MAKEEGQDELESDEEFDSFRHLRAASPVRAVTVRTEEATSAGPRLLLSRPNRPTNPATAALDDMIRHQLQQVQIPSLQQEQILFLATTQSRK